MRQRFIQSFSTSGDVQTAIDGGQLGKPYVVYLEDEERIDWNSKEATPPLSAQPLTFEILSAGTIMWTVNRGSTHFTISYSVNNGEWNEISTSGGTVISVNQGDIVRFVGDNPRYATNSSTYARFSTSAGFNVKGNIMSLTDSTNFKTATTLSANYTFTHLFEGCHYLISAKNLLLPATTLRDLCYNSMFMGCFSLTDAPELPATVLASSCYGAMYSSCYKLTSVPELPATALVSYCYSSMFQNCSALNYVKCLATDISASNCTLNWLQGVSPMGTFVKHPDATWTSGVSGIPDGWTVEDADI